MKKKTVLVHPCPKCGSNFLAHGKPYGCTTPRILAWLGSLHGVICVSCGHYAPTVKAWNREWENAEAALRELHARQPEMERLYIDGKILPGELQALVMVNNCLEREFIHRKLATGQPLHLNI